MDGNGTWSTTSAIWYNGSTAGNLWSNGTGDTAVFGNASSPNTSYTATISGTVNAGAIVFNEPYASTGNYGLTGGIINGPAGGTLNISDPSGQFFNKNYFQNVTFTGASNYQCDASTGVVGGGLGFFGNTTFSGSVILGNGTDTGTIQWGVTGNPVGTGNSIAVNSGTAGGWTLYVPVSGTCASVLHLNSLGNRENGTLCFGSNGGNWTGPITLGGDASIMQGIGTSPYTVSGNISGNHNLYLGAWNGVSAGQFSQLVISGSNSYTGATLLVNTSGNPSGGVINDPVVLGANNTLPVGTTIVLGVNGGQSPYSGITAPNTLINAGALGGNWNGSDAALDLHGFSQTVAGLAVGAGRTGSNQFIGNYLNGTTSTLTISGTSTPSGANGGFGGSITDHFGVSASTGIVALNVAAGGFLTLTGSNTYTGATTVNGTLIVNGTNAGSVTVEPGGTLGGGGQIGAATTVYGTMNPGAGLLTAANLTVNNAVTFNNNSKYTVNIDATRSIADELTIGGGHNLTLNPGSVIQFVLASGSSTASLASGNYPLVSVGGGGTLTGTFATNSTLPSNWTIQYTSTAVELVIPVVTGTTGNGLIYSASNGQITITGYTGTGGAVTIPSTIPGVTGTVTSIGTDAFEQCTSLTSVTIPAGVTSIASSAFSGCLSLNSAVFVGNAPSMGSNVFASTASDFTVVYFDGATGFTSPTWQGYPSQADSPIPGVLQPYVDQHSLAGAVTLVATGTQVLALDAVGYQDIASNTPMATNSLFWIASMSKAMCCTALMMLVDEGKVSVDDPVQKYLPEFQGEVVWSGTAHTTTHAQPHPFTIREAMSMNAGFQGPYASDQPTIDAHSLAATVAGYASVPLYTDPGTNYYYANASINTVGEVVEVVSGMPYEQFLQQRLFNPLGMVDTTFWPTTAQLTRLATSYMANTANNGLTATTVNQLAYPLNNTTTRYANPAGGLFSTASDEAKFCQMLLNRGVYGGQRILSRASALEMESDQLPLSFVNSYGYGLAINGPDFNHAGAYKTNMDVNTQMGLVRVFMVQMASDWPNGIGSSNTILNAFMAAGSDLLIGANLIDEPPVPATGTIVMQDNFTYTTSNINGHAPTTGAGTWQTSYAPGSIISTDGTKANFVLTSGTDPSNYNAELIMPFTPLPNSLYTLSATFHFSGCTSRNSWAALGFSSSVVGADPPWMFLGPQASPTTDAGAKGIYGPNNAIMGTNVWDIYAALYPDITETITLNTATNEASYYINGFYETSTPFTSPQIQNLFCQSLSNCDILTLKNITLTRLSLNSWANSYFPPAEQNNPNIVGPTATPQGDGIPNLLKCFCDIDPGVPMDADAQAALPAGAIITVGATNYLTLTYQQNSWATGVSANLQTSTDLKSWQTVTPNLTRTVSTDYVTGDQTFKIGVNVTGLPKQFIRLQVTGY
jgi:CubicO group peptidase (beta-lactamase class C family)